MVINRSVPAAPSASKLRCARCTATEHAHVAVGTTIEHRATATPAVPAGGTLQIFDKPQGHTLAPKSG